MASRIGASDRPAFEELLRPPGWHADAQCRKYPGVDFFPRGAAALPKSICGRCCVRAECLAFALATDADGVWGGTTAKERRYAGKVVSSGAA